MWARREPLDFRAARQQMVLDQLERRGIADPDVLEALTKIPREKFVPDESRRKAYSDEPLQIGYGQTISQPYMTALMTQALDLHEGERVLEVGTGSGYHAAVLAELGAHVISVERIAGLVDLARVNLDRAGYTNRVTVVHGDGSLGWPAESPYDAISVAASAPHVPQALLDQLVDGGRLVIPVGTLDEHDLLLYARHGDQWVVRTVTHCRFVPLLGEQGWKLQ
jgi:protein-L-isoaspartate(D-aspartate) O-methyltransferase